MNCSKISATKCDFTPTSLSQGFLRYFNVSLRVRAELPGLPGRASAWASVPWFQHYRNGERGPLASLSTRLCLGPASHPEPPAERRAHGTPRSWL